ncbi:MAG: 1-deoxy-D-xylulose-5-phosphate synthase [Verrucomicrobia bacterium]|nr:1-deoxy-D-xylulose-5-phosphate synthase [Verrucomicrobiota bacterium]
MASTKFILGMRDAFFNALYEFFKRDPEAVFISADNGAPTLDQFHENLPNQYFNVGIAEQQLIGMACGMALEGKKVYTYAIAPFVTIRCYEQTKLDVCAMNLPITCIGVGAGYAYDIMGPTHHTVEDLTVMRALPNMTVHSPADAYCAEALAEISYRNPSPQYIRFDRAGVPEIYGEGHFNFADGVLLTRPGGSIALVATGIMVHQALKVADELAKAGVQARVIDLCRIKPVNTKRLFEYLKGVNRVVSMEEHFLAGGLGSLLAEIFVDNDVRLPLLRIGQDDRYVFDNGGREVIWEKYGLDVRSMTDRILRWAK